MRTSIRNDLKNFRDKSTMIGSISYQEALRSLSIISLLSVIPTVCSGGFQIKNIYDSPSSSSSYQSPYQAERRHGGFRRPEFVLSDSSNVTAILGSPASLTCRVRNVNNRTVSWLRHSDTHLLTAGRYTYTSDERFRAIHKVLSEDYILRIDPVQTYDSGLYECQVSTTPVMSHVVSLHVTEPVTIILGGGDILVEEGDTMNLTCLVKDSPEPPQFIFWFHNDEEISYDSPRGGVSQITEKGSTTSSFLLVQQSDLSDSGSYSCQPSVGNTATANVHVIRSGDPEKWVTNGKEAGRCIKMENFAASCWMIYCIFYTKFF